MEQLSKKNGSGAGSAAPRGNEEEQQKEDHSGEVYLLTAQVPTGINSIAE